MDYNNKNMGQKDIQSLLEKYWEGESSLNEESALFDYFNSGKVVEELKMYQPMFQYFKSEKSTRIENEDFDEMLLSKLEATTVVPMRSRRRGIVRMIASVAAVVLVIMSVYITYQQFSPTTPAPENEYLSFDDLTDEEQQAYETTKLALLYVSSKLQKGTKIATDNFSKVQQKAKEAAERE